MVSHPETGSDSPIGSDRDRGRDSHSLQVPGSRDPLPPDLGLTLKLE